jgi:hypothetical protein
VPRRVKDFIDISEYTSLDDLIRYLETIRDNLPPEHQAELKIRGDEVFGRRLTISYFREQTPEEVEVESKYDAAAHDEGANIEELRRKLDEAVAIPHFIAARCGEPAPLGARLIVVGGLDPLGGSIDAAGSVEPVQAICRQASPHWYGQAVTRARDRRIHLSYSLALLSPCK